MTEAEPTQYWPSDSDDVVTYRVKLVRWWLAFYVVGGVMAVLPAASGWIDSAWQPGYPSPKDMTSVFSALATLTIALNVGIYHLEKDKVDKHLHFSVMARFNLLDLGAAVCGLLAAVSGCIALGHAVSGNSALSVLQAGVSPVIVLFAVLAADVVPKEVRKANDLASARYTFAWASAARAHWGRLTAPGEKPVYAPRWWRGLWAFCTLLLPVIGVCVLGNLKGANANALAAVPVSWMFVVLFGRTSLRSYLVREWGMAFLCSCGLAAVATAFVVTIVSACRHVDHTWDMALGLLLTVGITAWFTLQIPTWGNRLSPFRSMVTGWFDRARTTAHRQLELLCAAETTKATPNWSRLRRWHASATGRPHPAPREPDAAGGEDEFVGRVLEQTSTLDGQPLPLSAVHGDQTGAGDQTHGARANVADA